MVNKSMGIGLIVNLVKLCRPGNNFIDNKILVEFWIDEIDGNKSLRIQSWSKCSDSSGIIPDWKHKSKWEEQSSQEN